MTLLRRAARPRSMRLLAAALIAPLLLLAASCNTGVECLHCQDIVSTIPWTAPETHTYTLTQDGQVKGKITLSITKDGDVFALEQNSVDDKGNSDVSVVRADTQTLKPRAYHREVLDSDQKRVVDVTYDDIDTSKCKTGRQAKITQTTFQPPTRSEPNSTRSIPVCVPENSYENDSSLFLWRTIKFEKGWTANYRTMLSNRGDLRQTVVITVLEQQKLKVGGSEVDAWLVTMEADQSQQRGWFATTPDHRLLRYSNGSLTFDITP
jgi:hypothetical protein